MAAGWRPAARVHAPSSVAFPEEAYAFGGGKNIVNVMLVDIRAWDTMGEIAVLLVAATGVASLVFLRTACGAIDRVGDVTPRDRRRRVWAGGPGCPTAVLRTPTARRADAARGASGPGATPRVAAPRRRLRSAPAPRDSVIFEVVTRLLFHTMVVVAVYLLFAGHNAPGGGFAGGLVAGIALIVRYLAGGRYELGEAAPVHPGLLLGTGPVPLGRRRAGRRWLSAARCSRAALLDVDVPACSARCKLVTSLFFDIGVFLVVVGLVLDVLRTLGAEVDRQGEVERTAPVDRRSPTTVRRASPSTSTERDRGGGADGTSAARRWHAGRHADRPDMTPNVVLVVVVGVLVGHRRRTCSWSAA